jgi:tetratricopeptide (TPR) repeat protein/predicted aspartyl protease
VLALALGLAAASRAHSAPRAPAAGGCKIVKMAELPVTMIGLVPTTPMKVNGIEAPFITDSGAFYSIVPPAQAARFHLKMSPAPYGAYTEGVGGEDHKLAIGTADEIELDHVPIKKVQFLITDFNEMDVGGLIGQNILGGADAEFDLADGVIRLFKSDGCLNSMLAYWTQTTPYSTVELQRMSRQQPHLIGTIKINGQPVRATFDTGAPRSYLSLAAARRLGFNPQAPGVEHDSATGGFGPNVRETWIARFDSFGTDGETVQNVRLRVFDTRVGDWDMLIGADFFLSHRIYMAKAQHRLFMTYNGGPVFNLEHPGADPQASKAAPAAAPAAQADVTADSVGRRAAASLARRDYAHAVADYSRAIQLDPKNPARYRDRAAARMQAGERELALADLNQAVTLKPGDADLLLARGAVYLELKDPPRAEADFAAALAATPKEDDTILAVGGLYEDRGQFEKAIAGYDAWIASHPDHKPSKEFFNARCWARTLSGKELLKALADCDAALGQDPRFANALDSRGLVNLRLGRFDQSIADYNAAIRLSPHNSWSFYGRGLAKRGKGQAAQGDADIARALVLDPEMPATARKYGIGEAAATAQ